MCSARYFISQQDCGAFVVAVSMTALGIVYALHKEMLLTKLYGQIQMEWTWTLDIEQYINLFFDKDEISIPK